MPREGRRMPDKLKNEEWTKRCTVWEKSGHKSNWLTRPRVNHNETDQIDVGFFAIEIRARSSARAWNANIPDDLTEIPLLATCFFRSPLPSIVSLSIKCVYRWAFLLRIRYNNRMINPKLRDSYVSVYFNRKKRIIISTYHGIKVVATMMPFRRQWRSPSFYQWAINLLEKEREESSFCLWHLCKWSVWMCWAHSHISLNDQSMLPVSLRPARSCIGRRNL